tara:strand:+ start:1162 stop:2310 length:1149 start_codon:yes stop_codon:yes gene_type:complete
MSHTCPHDPFKKFRQNQDALTTDFDGEPITMILGHKNIRAASRDYATYSSDAPFRVPIPSEENLRRVRQLPIEVNPPDHTDYRKIIEPYFKLPNQPEFKEKIGNLIGELLEDACQRGTIEIVREFSLPLQSRALTYLLQVPESEADIWIGWGIHVFKDGDDEGAKGLTLENYINEQFDRAEANPGDDFFSALGKAEYRGRPLTRDEKMGFANLTFAGGRDTIIHTISFIIAYIAEHPEALDKLRENPKLIRPAGEEFVRVITPLTHIGRQCPVTTDVHGETVQAGDRVSLCWASANFDETVFEAPEEIRLDRKPNPHIAYGSGPHTCLGAPHARVIIGTLLQKLCDTPLSIKIKEAAEHIEKEADYERRVGFDSLTVEIDPA